MRYIFILFIIFLISPIKIYAQGTGGINVNPAFIDVEVEDPLERKVFQITYKNNGTDIIELEIFPVDFTQTDERGTIGFLGREAGSYQYSLSSFLSFETNSVILDPGETKSINTTVSNRKDLSPGGHYSAIVGRIVPNESTTSATTTKIAPAVSSLVYLVKKGGESYNLSLKDVDWPKYPVVFNIPSTLVLTFQNEGNVHLTPFGTILVKDMLGREVFKGSLNNSSFKVMPSSRRIIPGYLNKLETIIPISFMTMEIQGTDFGKNTNFVFRESFIYINPLTLLILVVIVPVLFILRKKRKKK